MKTRAALFATLSIAVQVRADIAGWDGFRGVQIQNVISLEGGIIQNGTWDGKQWQTTTAEVTYGTYFQVDLAKSFDVSIDPQDSYLVYVPESTNPDAIYYVNGAMFANQNSWFTFGGLAKTAPSGTDATSISRGDVINYPGQSPHPFGVAPDLAVEGITSADIASGAYCTQPDQKMSWHFGGLVGTGTGALLELSGDTSPNHPTIATEQFFQADSTKGQTITFEQLKWPEGVAGRGEASLVWLPYGEKGVLLSLGGVVNPADLYTVPPTTLKADDSPLMEELLVYDIAGETWTSINATGPVLPPQSAKGCALAIPTKDGKGSQIFYYGGYDGTYLSSNANSYDDVWLLSVPAFQWTRVYQGDQNGHGRQGHVCVSPMPDTILIFGGVTPFGSPLQTERSVDVFDTIAMNWTGKYDAASTRPWTANQAIIDQLKWPNGDGPGEAAVTGLPGDLNTLFSTAYTGVVQSYLPYGTAANDTANSNNSTSTTQPLSNSSHSWKIPVIATLCTVIPIALLALVAFFGIRRRRKVNQTSDSRKQVFSWLGKADPRMGRSETSDATAVESQGDYFGEKKVAGQVYEAPTDDTLTTSPGWPQSGTVGTLASISPGFTHPHEMHAPEDFSMQRSGSRFSEGLPVNGAGLELRYELAGPDAVLPTPTRSDTLSPASLSPAVATSHRPPHNRNESSLSDIPSLPSPGPEEERRQSQLVDTLADIGEPVKRDDKSVEVGKKYDEH